MPQTGHYIVGLVMFCLAFMFTMGLGSFLQQAALVQQQQVAAATTQFDMPLVSMLPPAAEVRKASF